MDARDVKAMANKQKDRGNLFFFAMSESKPTHIRLMTGLQVKCTLTKKNPTSEIRDRNGGDL
jgi:hypothetical protein